MFHEKYKKADDIELDFCEKTWVHLQKHLKKEHLFLLMEHEMPTCLYRFIALPRWGKS